MEHRKNVMETIIDLNNFFIREWNRKEDCFELTHNPIFTKDWLNTKFDRFYLVENISNLEEKFWVKIELRYSLRSKEANAYGKEHQAFYDRFLSTTSFYLDEIENPEEYKNKIINSRIIQ